jgi:hypothetical protein
MLTMHAMKAAEVLFAFSLTVCPTMPCFAQTSTQPEPQAQNKSQVTEGLEVRIIPDRSRIVVGQQLTLRIEIWNTGDEDFYICRNMLDFGAHACRLTLTFTPRGKGGGHGLAGDCYYQKPPPAEEFAGDLAALWILLPPKHFYGTTLKISREDYNRELEEPGRYRLTGEYDSEGLMSGINCNATSYFPDQVAKLRNKAWVGKIQSTPVTIQVVKAKPLPSASSASR